MSSTNSFCMLLSFDSFNHVVVPTKNGPWFAIGPKQLQSRALKILEKSDKLDKNFIVINKSFFVT